jgi:hypothetical protein
MKSLSIAPSKTRRVSVLKKVVLLTSVLVAFFIAAQLATNLRLNQATRLIEGQAQAVRHQSRILAEQTQVLAQLKLLHTLTDALHELRYWSIDLSLSLKTESEKLAQAAQAKIAPLLVQLGKSEPQVVQAVQPILAGYVKEMAAAADAYTDGNRVLGNSLVSAGHLKIIALDTHLASVLKRVEAHAAEAGKRVQAAVADVETSGAAVIAVNRTTIIVAYAGLAGAILIGAGALIYLARSVFRPFGAVVTALRTAAAESASATDQVSSSSRSLADGASEQAASLEETSSALEEMSSMTKRNADHAASAKTLANQTRTAAETGASDMARMEQAMAAIKASSDNIAKIIKTIDEIAFQTNILALNAAVEAARAGEAGLGFAVVAEEVRSLAQRSAQAARETAERIEDSIRKSEHGAGISGKVAASLQEIVGKARKVDELIGEIAGASSEQSQGILEVNRAVTQMDKITQSNAASAEESASAATQLAGQAATLEQTVETLLNLVGDTTRDVVATKPVPKSTSKTSVAKRALKRLSPLPVAHTAA